MDLQQLTQTVDNAFERRDTISISTTGEVRDAVDTALELLDSGAARVAEKVDGEWVVNQWLKKGCSAVVSTERNGTDFGWSGRLDLGGTRSTASSRAGARTASHPQAFEPFRTVLCANPPSSRQASC